MQPHIILQDSLERKYLPAGWKKNAPAKWYEGIAVGDLFIMYVDHEQSADAMSVGMSVMYAAC